MEAMLAEMIAAAEREIAGLRAQPGSAARRAFLADHIAFLRDALARHRTGRD